MLMVIGAWVHRYCDGEIARYVDVERGLEIEPFSIDAVTDAKLGSRPIRMNAP